MADIGIILLIIIVASNVLLFTWLVLARWYHRWKYNKLKRGLINYLGLTEWYDGLSAKEQGEFRKYYTNIANVPSTVDRLTDADIYSASETPSQLLVMVSAGSIMDNNYLLANKLLLKANSEATTPWEKQQVLLAYSYLYFKQRNQLTGARANCISYSERAIRNIERFGVSDDVPPTLPFDQLIALNEEAGDFGKAAEVAAKAATLFRARHKEIAVRYEKKKEELASGTR
jgi:hypothetical protein